MAPCWDHSCTAICPRCSYTFTVTDCTTGRAFIDTRTIYFNTWFPSRDRLKRDLPNAKEIERQRWSAIHSLAPEAIPRAPRLLVALNTGMHIRRMRASAGLARART